MNKGGIRHPIIIGDLISHDCITVFPYSIISLYRIDPMTWNTSCESCLPPSPFSCKSFCHSRSKLVENQLNKTQKGPHNKQNLNLQTDSCTVFLCASSGLKKLHEGNQTTDLSSLYPVGSYHLRLFFSYVPLQVYIPEGSVSGKRILKSTKFDFFKS